MSFLLAENMQGMQLSASSCDLRQELRWILSRNRMNSWSDCDVKPETCITCLVGSVFILHIYTVSPECPFRYCAIVFSRSPQLRAISARGPGWCRQKPLWRQAYAFPSKTQGQSWPSWHCFEEKVSGCSITTVTAPVIGTLATGWTKEIAVVDAKTCNDLKWFEHWKPVFWWCVYQYQNMKLEHKMRWVPNRWNLLYSTYIAEHDMKPEPTSYKKSWVWFGGASFWSLPASYPKEEKSHRPLFPCPRIMREM